MIDELILSWAITTITVSGLFFLEVYFNLFSKLWERLFNET